MKKARWEFIDEINYHLRIISKHSPEFAEQIRDRISECNLQELEYLVIEVTNYQLDYETKRGNMPIRPKFKYRKKR